MKYKIFFTCLLYLSRLIFQNTRKNTYIAGNTMIENIYSKQLRNVDITDTIIRPLGKNIISQGLYKKHNIDDEMKFFIPVYENETKFSQHGLHVELMKK